MSSLPYQLRLSRLPGRRCGALGVTGRRRVPVRQMPSVGVRIVSRVLVGEPRAEPRRPADPDGIAEPGERHLVFPEHKLDLPGLLQADVEPDEVVQRARAPAARQKTLIVAKAKRPDHHAEAALRMPGALADDRICAELGEALAQADARALCSGDREPLADELLDSHRHAEVV